LITTLIFEREKKMKMACPYAGSMVGCGACRIRRSGCRRANLKAACCVGLLLFVLGTLGHAQTPLSNAVFTVGTTTRDGSNRDWSYVLLDSPDPVVVAGRRFAVFGKVGNASSPNTFTQRGTIALQTDLASISALLNQSILLGQDLASLHDAFARVIGTNILGLLSHVPGIVSQTLPQRVLTAIQLSSADPELAESLAFLARGNPGMSLCLGRAFSEQITGVTTYEFRELNPATGAPGEVAGRVTVTPGVPVALTAPGRPFQVVTNDPSDHLLVRLRWGTPAELRRLSLLQVGYNVWRISRADAEAGNFHMVPPTAAQLRTNAKFTRANLGPVLPPFEMEIGNGPGGAENPADRIQYFFGDNGRSMPVTFSDGDEFYYFVTARDILGRDGFVSPGGLSRACRRLPPDAPSNVSVENVVLPGSTNLPRLLVSWDQNMSPADAVSHYWIYRWVNPSGALTNDAVPLSNRVAVVSHAPGTNANSFIDNTPGALTAPNLSNVWYTVRAVSVAACDPLLSPHSAPAWGVLRQREGPAATSGELLGSCGIPVVMFQKFVATTINSDTQNVHMRLTCVRRDPGIAWVRFSVTNNVSFEVRTLGPVYFPPDGDTVQIDYVSPALITSQARQIYVGCVVGTGDDRVSQSAVCIVNTPFASTEQREAVFFAGQLLATALNGSDPLLNALNGGATQCLPGNSVTPDTSGMVSMTFDFNDAPTVLVQALEGNNWVDVGIVSPDANRLYWVPFPACLVGPVPAFRGCRVSFPTGNGDCEQHVAAGPIGGAIAPIRVRFRLTPRTREYRVYRRVDDGPMTLFSQGAALYDPSKPGKLIEARDEAMPPSAARLCYFVQLLDEHGNGSPLAFVGCRNVKPAKLPRPILAEPSQAGTIGNPQVLLNWFCPTAGVSRFQIKVAFVDAESSGASSGISSSQLKIFSGYNKLAGFMGLTKNALQIISFSEAHYTPYVGPGFGPGPHFILPVTVSSKATYDISVTPVDEQGKVRHESTSEVWRFKWTPPVQLATVPWPARPLPPAREFEPDYATSDLEQRMQVTAFIDYNNALEDRRRPAGVRIGRLDSSFSIQAGRVGDTNAIVYNHANSIVNGDPHHGLFRSLSSDPARANRTILPMVIYRQQVTNNYFPKVSGDVVQVSPMIERIPYIYDSSQRLVTIPDPLLRIRTETYNDHTYHFLYVCDQQPLVLGARYHYFVVRFNDKREPEDIIPAGEAELPLQPFGGP
jgi:hypothetical protein